MEPAVPCAPVEAYARSAADLHRVLSELSREEWDAPAHESYGSVGAVVAHLVGVEELVLAWVGARDVVDAELAQDHVRATRGAVERLSATEPDEVIDVWRAVTEEVERSCRAVPAATPVVAHDLPTDVDGLLVLRTFELWAHTDDVCRAVGRVAPIPDAERLALMSSRLMGALPFALALRGTEQPGRTARFVLTGAGGSAGAGGTYDVSLDASSPAGPADVVVVVDVVDICRTAARRLSSQELRVAVEGDADLVDVVLAAVDAFARD
jgi:uncharacterized protein (TIGR03083 family)